MATECEKSVQALVTHLRVPSNASNPPMCAVVSQKPSSASKTVSPIISVSDDDSGCGGSSGGNMDHALYEWCPENLTSDQVAAYFSGWPEDKVPFIGSVGAEWRRTQLMTQLPLHDQDIKKCKSLVTSDEKREMRLFIGERKRDALGQGCARQIPQTHYAMQCTRCGGEVPGGDIAVYAVRSGHAKVWHPACFQCDVCNELLVDLIYFWKDPHIYCGRHHAHTLKPRCSACDEIIFSDECTEAEGSWWHLDHFCCVECDAQLGGQRYIMHNSQPYCIHCYESIFAQQCSTCKNVIGVDEGQMSYENQHWHATDTCFCCANCNKALLGLPFLPKRKTLFCSLACNNNYASTPSSSTANAQPSTSSNTDADFASTPPNGNTSSKSMQNAAEEVGTNNALLTIERLTQNLTLKSAGSLCPASVMATTASTTTTNALTDLCAKNSSTSNSQTTVQSGWNSKACSLKQPPLSRNSLPITSPKNFVKPFNYIPPKTVLSGDQSKTTSIPQSLSHEFNKDEEDNDSAVSSMAGSHMDTPPVNTDIYDPTNGEEPPPLPPKPAFMKGHASPEKILGCPVSPSELAEDQLVIRGEEHVYSEASKAKFQRSLPNLHKKKSNLKMKPMEEDFASNCAHSKNVSFNPNVRERTRSSSLPRSNSTEEFPEEGTGVVDPEYQFRKSHYRSRPKCSRRSRRHTSSHYHHHFNQHHYNHEYCSDPEECTVGSSERGFSTLPWEYYSDSSSSTSSSSDDEDTPHGFIAPLGGHQFASQGAQGQALGSVHSQRHRRHRHSRRVKKSKCKIS